MHKTMILSALIAVLTVGCFNHAYVNPNVTPELEPSYSRWHSHWLAGLISSTAPVELDEVCPQGVARIENVQTFVNGLIGALIGIVYFPTTVKVYCVEATAAVDVEIPSIDAQKLRAMADADPDLEMRLVDLRDEAELESAMATGPMSVVR